jgi:UDP-glucose 4-epimerase
LLDRVFDSDHKNFWKNQQVMLLEFDLLHLQQTHNADVVIHAAAITADARELGVSAETYLQNSLELNFHMIAWARANAVKRFIFISSAGVFAPQQDNLDETALPQNKGLYALAKRATEDLIETLASDEKLDFLSVRLGNVYGENERPRPSRPRVSLLQRILDEALEQGVIHVPNETHRDWTYAPDIAKLFVHFIEAPVLNYRLYHLVSPEQFSPLELAQKIQMLLPSTRLEVSTTPLTQLRAPLKSERLQTLGFMEWTPFETGLAQLIQAQRGVAA